MVLFNATRCIANNFMNSPRASARTAATVCVRKGAGRVSPCMPYYQHKLHFTTSVKEPNATNTQQHKPISKTKQFMKKYGYVGIGVYLTLSALDLAATMAVINVKGAAKVMEVEHYVLGKVKSWVGLEHPPLDKSRLYECKPSLTSIFVVAYGIHKTVLLPVRLSLTAAITPTVARRLKNWGWLKSKLPK